MFSIIFFGSFQQHSLTTLKLLLAHPNFKIIAVVTSPPRPGDRGQIQPTSVHQYCLDQKIPVFPLENLDKIPSGLPRPDFIVVAGYGQLIPPIWLNFPQKIAINAHPSLLPEYAGRFPAEWAILRDEKQTGISLIKMSPKFDQGDILIQKTLPIASNDTRQTLYQKLFALIGQTLVDILPQIDQITPKPQTTKGFYARQLTRQDGFVSWQSFLDQNQNDLDRKIRALHPWPGVWTLTPQGKRLKILSLAPLTVQLESKTPAPWNQIKNNLISPSSLVS